MGAQEPDWQDKVPNKHRAIREYLSESLPELRMFSVGQVIGESVYEDDFRKRENRGQRCESVGINWHRVGDERALHERRSCSIVAPSHARAIVRLHVKR